MDRVPGTCHLQEAAVLLALGTGKAGTKLQSVLDLLAGHGHQAGHVAKGADGLAGLEAPGASLHIGADAAAVHDGDITVELLDLVEVGVDAVGHEVAEVGLAGADAALAGGGIVDVEFGTFLISSIYLPSFALSAAAERLPAFLKEALLLPFR